MIRQTGKCRRCSTIEKILGCNEECLVASEVHQWNGRARRPHVRRLIHDGTAFLEFIPGGQSDCLIGTAICNHPVKRTRSIIDADTCKK